MVSCNIIWGTGYLKPQIATVLPVMQLRLSLETKFGVGVQFLETLDLDIN